MRSTAGDTSSTRMFNFFSPEISSSGPRWELSVSTLASVQGFEFAVAAWKRGRPAAGTENCSYSTCASPSTLGVADGQGQHAAERCRVDGHRHGGKSPSGEDLSDQPSERVPDDRRLLVQLGDDVGEVVGHLLDGHMGEHFRVRVGLVHRLRLVRPAGSEYRVARLFEDLRPPVPAEGSSHRPWMNTTGGRPEALAAFTCFASCAPGWSSLVASLSVKPGGLPLRTTSVGASVFFRSSEKAVPGKGGNVVVGHPAATKRPGSQNALISLKTVTGRRGR